LRDGLEPSLAQMVKIANHFSKPINPQISGVILTTYAVTDHYLLEALTKQTWCLVVRKIKTNLPYLSFYKKK
jgi:hypothetical protein